MLIYFSCVILDRSYPIFIKGINRDFIQKLRIFILEWKKHSYKKDHYVVSYSYICIFFSLVVEQRPEVLHLDKNRFFFMDELIQNVFSCLVTKPVSFKLLLISRNEDVKISLSTRQKNNTS